MTTRLILECHFICRCEYRNQESGTLECQGLSLSTADCEKEEKKKVYFMSQPLE